MIAKAIPFVKKLILEERTAPKLALASSLGIFIAFSPLIGLHWALTIIFAWAFQLNVGIIYLFAHINNPATMVFIYWACHAFGQYIMQSLFNTDLLAHNPSWMNWLNLKLSCLGIPNLSLWAFMIGGHILAILAAGISYPLLLRFYNHIKGISHESYSAK